MQVRSKKDTRVVMEMTREEAQILKACLYYVTEHGASIMNYRSGVVSRDHLEFLQRKAMGIALKLQYLSRNGTTLGGITVFQMDIDKFMNPVDEGLTKKGKKKHCKGV